MIDRFQKYALQSRLGIPLLYGIDAVHGNNSVYGATIFPHHVSLVATGDADLVQRIGFATALEVRASGIHYNFAPFAGAVTLWTHKRLPFCGWKAFVISDWEGLDKLSDPCGSNYRDCVLTSINAGIDMVMMPFKYKLFMGDLLYLVESGEILMSRIDDAVERILRVKFVAGLFEVPLTDRSLLVMVGCKQHKELAREAAHKSLVLLKNGKDPKNPFLPLDRNARKILVAGTHADDLGYQCGGWTGTWHGSSGRFTIGTTTLDAVQEAVGNNTEVIYEQNPSPETFVGQDFLFAIVAVGEGPYAESTGDNSELTIPFNGAEIISLVAGKVPTLVILISGRPLVLEPLLLEKMDALVAAWLPGSEGAGITDVVFGDYAFEGRLPVRWFKRVEQLPMHVGENSYDPFFPFGFRLTSSKKGLSNW